MPRTRPREPSGPRAYPVALITVMAALGVALLLRPLAGIENVDLVFLTAVVGVAVRYGLGPSLAASVASVLAYNFFFIPPFHTFAVAARTTGGVACRPPNAGPHRQVLGNRARMAVHI